MSKEMKRKEARMWVKEAYRIVEDVQEIAITQVEKMKMLPVISMSLLGKLHQEGVKTETIKEIWDKADSVIRAFIETDLDSREME